MKKSYFDKGFNPRFGIRPRGDFIKKQQIRLMNHRNDDDKFPPKQVAGQSRPHRKKPDKMHRVIPKFLRLSNPVELRFFKLNPLFIRRLK